MSTVARKMGVGPYALSGNRHSVLYVYADK